MNRLEPFTGIFFLGPKIEFFAKGGGGGGGGKKSKNDQILKNFQVSFLHLFKFLYILVIDSKVTFSFVGYLFVAVTLGGLRSVPEDIL